MNPNESLNHSPTKLPLTPQSPRRVSETQQPTTTPFLHNLTSRLRKGSNASSLSNGEPASATPQDPVTKTESTRIARKAVLSQVRTDWEYPPSKEYEESQFRREPIGYRAREESQSDLEAEEIFARRRTKNDPYKFESPDSIGVHLAERRRKRRRLAEDELLWNDGLRTWSQRRDLWTGAVKHKPRDHQQQQPHSSMSKRDPRQHRSRLSRSMSHRRNASESTDGSWPLSAPSPMPEESSSIDSMAESPTTTTDPTNPLSEEGPWLPIYPPLIPEEDSLRSRIKPAAYATIYSKIVVQSLSPNVPIPLMHMMSALVEGWKAEGNWPPQPSALAPQDVKKGRRSSAFLRWRKEHHADIKGADAVTGNEDGKSRVRRSIGMMKKVLGGGGGDGLEELGIEFREQDAAELERNVALNKGVAQA